MLSRIGNSLFWMGRYIERAEHMARYTKVQYVSSLEAPLAQRKDFVLGSILNMNNTTDNYFARYPNLTDNDVLHYVTIDDQNPLSIISCIANARENARGARDSISMELWEAINKFYHLINGYSLHQLMQEGPYGFSEIIESNSSIIKGYIDNSLLRNEVWLLISLGLHVERAIQVTRILLSKVNDIAKIEDNRLGGPMENYQWTTLLKSAESFDMSKRYYTSMPNKRNTLEFLIFSTIFPKSITFNLNLIFENIKKLGQRELATKDSLEFLVGKITMQYQFLTIKEVETNIADFLDETLGKLSTIAYAIEKKYLMF